MTGNFCDFAPAVWSRDCQSFFIHYFLINFNKKTYVPLIFEQKGGIIGTQVEESGIKVVKSGG